MTADAWLDKLTDMGLDADVACWELSPSQYVQFSYRCGSGYGRGDGDGCVEGDGWSTNYGSGFGAGSGNEEGNGRGFGPWFWDARVIRLIVGSLLCTPDGG